jgi:hypothetical protein
MPQCLAVILVAFVAAKADAQIHGVVLDETGKRVPSAEIIVAKAGDNDYIATVTTSSNESGEFEVAVASAILAKKPGYLPTLHKLVDNERSVELRLKPLDSEPTLRFGPCSSQEQEHGIALGFGHRLPLPDGVLVDSKSHIDVVQSVIAFKAQENQILTIWTGMYAFEQPRLDALSNSSQFSARVVEGLPTTEMSGVLDNGKRWRWIPLASGYVDYYDASPEAADYFDDLIAHACTLDPRPQSSS